MSHTVSHTISHIDTQKRFDAFCFFLFSRKQRKNKRKNSSSNKKTGLFFTQIFQNNSFWPPERVPPFCANWGKCMCVHLISSSNEESGYGPHCNTPHGIQQYSHTHHMAFSSTATHTTRYSAVQPYTPHGIQQYSHTHHIQTCTCVHTSTLHAQHLPTCTHKHIKGRNKRDKQLGAKNTTQRFIPCPTPPAHTGTHDTYAAHDALT